VSDVFDRCDDDTVTVLDTARGQSQQLGHGWIGTEHVLLALTIHHDLLPDPVTRLLPDEEQVRQALTAVVDPGPAVPEAELLGSLGIDLDDVRAAVRATFGREALERLARRRVHQPWQPWRRPTRACVSLLAGTQGIAPRLKRALDHASDHATRRQQDAISPAALLLGMIEVEDAMSNRLLEHLGVAPDHLRAAAEAAS
jgi:ATP-dependent Clp protease ATP-binding subunit ClpA